MWTDETCLSNWGIFNFPTYHYWHFGNSDLPRESPDKRGLKLTYFGNTGTGCSSFKNDVFARPLYRSGKFVLQIKAILRLIIY